MTPKICKCELQPVSRLSYTIRVLTIAQNRIPIFEIDYRFANNFQLLTSVHALLKRQYVSKKTSDLAETFLGTLYGLKEKRKTINISKIRLILSLDSLVRLCHKIIICMLCIYEATLHIANFRTKSLLLKYQKRFFKYYKLSRQIVGSSKFSYFLQTYLKKQKCGCIFAL